MKKEITNKNEELNDIKIKLEEGGINLEYTISKLKELMECDVKDIALRATIKALELLTNKDKKQKIEVDKLNLYYLQKEKEENGKSN